MIIDRPKPIVDQVNQILRQQIRSGMYPPGRRLPSESELATAFGVSRATIRSVLAALEAERIITRRQGDGTYINKRLIEINTQLGSKWDFQCMIEDSGRTPSAKVISAQKRAPLPQEIEALEILPEDPVFVMVRLFLADEHPVIFSTNVVPLAFFNEDAETDLTLPIHLFLRKHCGQEIAYSVSDISATLAQAELSGFLNLQPDEPVLKFFDIFYNSKDRPLVFGESYYDDKVLRMRVARAWG